MMSSNKKKDCEFCKKKGGKRIAFFALLKIAYRAGIKSCFLPQKKAGFLFENIVGFCNIVRYNEVKGYRYSEDKFG